MISLRCSWFAKRGMLHQENGPFSGKHSIHGPIDMFDGAHTASTKQKVCLLTAIWASNFHNKQPVTRGLLSQRGILH